MVHFLRSVVWIATRMSAHQLPQSAYAWRSIFAVVCPHIYNVPFVDKRHEMSRISFDPWWHLHLISEIYWGKWRLRQSLCSWAVEYSIWCLIVQHSLLLGRKTDRASRTARCFDSALLPCTNLVLNKGRQEYASASGTEQPAQYLCSELCMPAHWKGLFITCSSILERQY